MSSKSDTKTGGTTPDNMSSSSKGSRNIIRTVSPYEYADSKHTGNSHRSKRSRGGKDINIFHVVTRTSKVVSSRVSDLSVVKLLLTNPPRLSQVCGKISTVFEDNENPLDLAKHSSVTNILKALGAGVCDTRPIIECVSVVADWCEQEGKTVEYGISQDSALYLLLYTYFGDGLITPSALLDARMSTLCDTSDSEIDEREKALFALYCKTLHALSALPTPPEDPGLAAPKALYFGTTITLEKGKNKFENGQKVSFPGFVSAVDSLEALAKLFPSDSGTVFEVSVNRKLAAHCIQPFSLYSGLREYVIEPLAAFKVTGRRAESGGKVIVVTMEPIESMTHIKANDVISPENLAELGSEILLGKIESSSSSVNEDDDDDDDEENGNGGDDKKTSSKSKKRDESSKVRRALRKNNKKAISLAKALVKAANEDLQTEYSLDKEFFDASCNMTKRVIRSSKRLGHSAVSEKPVTMKMTSIPAGFGKFEG